MCKCSDLPPISSFIIKTGGNLTAVDIVQSREGCEELALNREASWAPEVTIKLLSDKELEEALKNK